MLLCYGVTARLTVQHDPLTLRANRRVKRLVEVSICFRQLFSPADSGKPIYQQLVRLGQHMDIACRQFVVVVFLCRVHIVPPCWNVNGVLMELRLIYRAVRLVVSHTAVERVRL